MPRPELGRLIFSSYHFYMFLSSVFFSCRNRVVEEAEREKRENAVNRAALQEAHEALHKEVSELRSRQGKTMREEGGKGRGKTRIWVRWICDAVTDFLDSLRRTYHNSDASTASLSSESEFLTSFSPSSPSSLSRQQVLLTLPMRNCASRLGHCKRRQLRSTRDSVWSCMAGRRPRGSARD